MVAITISGANGRAPSIAKKSFPLTIEVGPEDTVETIKKKVATKCPKLYTSRQKLALKGAKAALTDELTVKDIGLASGGELDIKDLGPQLGWRFVYFVEYLGPLLIHPLFYYLPQYIYGKAFEHSELQKYAYGMIMAHFVKREFETLFIHRFSHGTMPARNILKNSGHYHILSGLLLAGDLYRPGYGAAASSMKNTIMSNPTFLNACLGAFTFFEISNLHTHLTQRNLRPAGTKTRAIPRGYGFNLVSCANYFFEICAWTVVLVMTRSAACALFLGAGGFQMAVWAAKKHKNYKKEFGKDYPKGRKAMIPFIF
ncbi:hypothetical protein CYLTODRAFT_372490 [Cylindrobasidium torrendii FP15055 ss-10]|uniref:very-long-chain enoyl-CoA reductase n=1 Tax=Cylindrobasidium torrendii FP15055 ss-10 TaxID=1314674 RepID=A0A0D7BGA5_9AGAR|nr:hypothetical protein CYLTODRAFT_372490 [Cylindrobasidium torrendii FP15055 ss-10]